jgi:DNA polymerase-1
MSRYYFDIEANNFLEDVTNVWIIATKNLDTGEKKYWLEGDLGWKEIFNNATLLIGHNVIAYDFPVLKKIFNYTLPKKVKIQDTLIISLVMDYNKFPHGQHSLENWGIYLGIPKGDFNDFSEYTPEMLEYCLQDLEVTEGIHKELIPLLRRVAEKSPNIKVYLNAEQAAVKWSTEASVQGWPFNKEEAIKLFGVMEKELTIAINRLQPRLGKKAVAIDKCKGIVDVKKPKWTKEGFYHASLAKYFDIHPFTGYPGEERLIEGPFCRVSFEDLKLTSPDDVKIFLYRNGWQPTQWNTKRDPITGQIRRTSPKITEDSLEFLEGDGKLYMEYTSTSARYNTLKNWIEAVTPEGRLHGKCFPIGTPSMRVRHEIIANIPSGERDKEGKAISRWGPEIRSLFTVLPGWSFIGADSSGNQARGLAYYLGSQEYIDLLLNGDIHQFNADIATEVLAKMGVKFTVTRAMAKRILYAFLFGAAGAKLWSYIFGVPDNELGNKFKIGFTKAVPGFKKLLDKLKNIYSATKEYGPGYIYGIAGNRIYVDSYHKLLVYLLQACEKATCATSLMLTAERLEEENIPYVPLIFYHDEIDFMVPNEYATRAAEISKLAFKEGPQLLGIDIMDGTAKIGQNWYECH